MRRWAARCVVFGPNNFPFAFNSVAGGDFVAAIAAGNPVIGKANTGHPGTSRLLAEIALDAVVAAGLPAAMVQLIYRTPPEVGFTLVSHPAVVATGFTGSKSAGLRLKAAADAAGKPIYLEMSSVNPVFVLPGALAERLSRSPASCSIRAPWAPASSARGRASPSCRKVSSRSGSSRSSHPASRRRARHVAGKGGVSAISEGVATLVEHGATVLAGGQPDDASRYAYPTRCCVPPETRSWRTRTRCRRRRSAR